MHGRKQSGPAIVAAKSPNKAARAVAEAMEPRAGAEENASRQRTHRTLSRERVRNALERVRQRAHLCFVVSHPRGEPYAGKPHVRIYAGGVQQCTSLPRSAFPRANILSGAGIVAAVTELRGLI